MAVQLLGHLAEASTYGILNHNMTIPSMPQLDNFWIYDLFVESAHFEFFCFGCFFKNSTCLPLVCFVFVLRWPGIGPRSVQTVRRRPVGGFLRGRESFCSPSARYLHSTPQKRTATRGCT